MGALFNLARMTSPTTGNGATLTLGSAVAGFLTFAQAGVADGATVSYGIRDGNASEVGNGVYTSTGTTLTRNVIKSTNADARIVLSGNAQVYVTAMAEDINAKVAKAGDTMAGDLTINKATPTIALTKTSGTSGTQASAIIGWTNAQPRWQINLGDSTVESGSNIGSDFSISRFGDAGGSLGTALQISRATGGVGINGQAGGGAQFGVQGINAAWTASITAATNTGGAFGLLVSAGTNNADYCLLARDVTGAKTYWGIYGNGTIDATSAGSTINLGPIRTPPWIGRLNVFSSPGVGIYGIAFCPDTDTGSNPCLFANAAGAGCGSISTTATTTAFNTSSDERLKTDLRSFDAGATIDAIEVYNFAWKSTGRRAHGVMAQRAVNVFPEAITHNEDLDLWGADYAKFVPLLLQELKSLRARVAELEARR